MRVAFFSSKTYDRKSFDQANAAGKHELLYLEPRLTAQTAVLAKGCEAVCIFVNDQADAAAVAALAEQGVRLVALRSAGFNNVDLKAAAKHGLTVVRVPAYSPYAVAEFAVGLLLTLNRKIHRAWMRVHEDNFELEGLVGHDLHGKTVGIVGTGRIGSLAARTFKLGFGCEVIAYDTQVNAEMEGIGVRYVDIDTLMTTSDIISLHCPLVPQTQHIINAQRLAASKPGLLLVNTSRGALIDTDALVAALKNGHLGGVAIDVYEHESELFFQDLSNTVVEDDVFERLLTFPNVLVTGHQAFFTEEALAAIAQTTLQNISNVQDGHASANQVGGLKSTGGPA